MVFTDPLYKLLMQNLDWEAFLVEPVPSLFDKLKRSYQGRANIRFLNIAVSDNDIDNPFYYLGDDVNLAGPGIPDWYDQLGSFNRDHVANCLGKNMINISKKSKSSRFNLVIYYLAIQSNLSTFFISALRSMTGIYLSSLILAKRAQDLLYLKLAPNCIRDQ